MRFDVILTSAIVILAFTGLSVYSATKERLKDVQEKNEQLQIDLIQADESIKFLIDSNKELADKIISVNEELAKIRQSTTILEKKLERHDLGALAESKPELIERIINNATAEASRCFELLSGAELNDKERSAQNANEFNSECPWLYERLRP